MEAVLNLVFIIVYYMLARDTIYLLHMAKQVKRQFIVDKKGNKVAVIITIHEYEGMLEDLHDLAIIAQRKEDAAISLDDMRKKLNSKR